MVHGAYHVAIHVDDGAYGPWVVEWLLPTAMQEFLIVCVRGIDLLQADRIFTKVKVGTKRRGLPARAPSREPGIRLRRFDRVLVKPPVGVGAMSLNFPGIEVVCWIVSRSFIVSVLLGKSTIPCVCGRRGTFDDLVHSLERKVPTWRHILLVNMTLAPLRNRVMSLSPVAMDIWCGVDGYGMD